MLRFLFNFFLIGLLLTLMLLLGTYAFLLPRLPSIEVLKDVQLQVPLRVFSRDGSLIAEFGEKRREPMKFADAPEYLIKAILAAEDDRFYEHPGVDWKSIARAVVNLVKTGEKSQGGSTITMQVARNFFLSREKTYLRKLNEILLARKIENELTKDEILELYLNKIYLGHRAYGVAAAAKLYYGSELKDLTLAQLAMIAGLPKAPSALNPITNMQRALTRRNYVLKRMLDLGYINQSQYTEAVAWVDNASLHNPVIELHAPYVAEMVRKYIASKYGDEVYTLGFRVHTTIEDYHQKAAYQALVQTLTRYDQRHGYRGSEKHFDLTKDSGEPEWTKLLLNLPPVAGLHAGLVTRVENRTLTVYSIETGLITIDWNGMSWARAYVNENRRGRYPQKAADLAKVGDIVRVVSASGGKWRLAQIPAVEGALVSLDSYNGKIKALVGGFNFHLSKFNRATQAYRQPGSSFKPFIYSAALESGFTPASFINDSPISFDIPGMQNPWRPENYSQNYRGPMRLRDALAYSRNVVSVKLLKAVGIDRAVRHIYRFGFPSSQVPPNLSLALGTGSVTPVQLAGAYAIFANGGYRVEPHFIDRIEDVYGKVVMQFNPPQVCPKCNSKSAQKAATDAQQEIHENGSVIAGESIEDQMPKEAPRAISAQNAWIMNSMMRDVIRIGTGRPALVLNRSDIAGKTGTTNDHKDAWFAGFNHKLVATAWMGFDDYHSLGNGETGGHASLSMWVEYMRTALRGTPISVMKQPGGLVTVRINGQTGELARGKTPKTVYEVFPTGAAPKKLAKKTVQARSTSTHSTTKAAVVSKPRRKVPEGAGITEQLF